MFWMGNRNDLKEGIWCCYTAVTIHQDLCAMAGRVERRLMFWMENRKYLNRHLVVLKKVIWCCYCYPLRPVCHDWRRVCLPCLSRPLVM